jgi:hypothetical protein
MSSKFSRRDALRLLGLSVGAAALPRTALQRMNTDSPFYYQKITDIKNSINL